ITDAVEDQYGTPRDLQRLLYDGNRLHRDCTLTDFGIENGSTLDLFPASDGGCGRMALPFADVSRSRAIKHIQLTADAPDWRVACEGLNMEGYCRKAGCPARNSMVIHQVGMAAFTLGSRCECPLCSLCGSAFQPRTCGLMACLWMYEGAKKD
ncbi:hypothetical protein JKP88DRAFT_148672, partial [Tribonema minus]